MILTEGVFTKKGLLALFLSLCTLAADAPIPRAMFQYYIRVHHRKLRFMDLEVKNE